VTQPVFVVICGINGAGKSTLADALAASSDLAGLPFLNPDRLSAGYREVDAALPREAADIRAAKLPMVEQHLSDLSEFGKLTLSGRVPVSGKVGEQAMSIIGELIALRAIPSKPARKAAA
jgi:hypothetical protein